MVGIEKLFVSLYFGKEELDVGELVYSNGKVYFKYLPAFVDTGLQISPFKMPLSLEILQPSVDFFDGLFGVFYDSLPDGWGRLVLDRALMSKGILPGQLNPLDRLAYVGSNGMGALTYRPAIPTGDKTLEINDIDKIARQTREVMEGNATDVIDELFILGGSSGGARPKILVGYHPEKEHIIQDKAQLPEGYEHWIIKFPASYDSYDIANIEYAYYKMALEAGIEMSQSKLFEGISGRAYFGTKRFDREGSSRLHMHSASGLMHDNYRLSNLDYGHLMDAAFKLEKHVGVYEKILRLAAFNVFAHNRDDHSKNFSFLMDHTGNWRFAPAYDLTFSFSSNGWHTTMVDGESKAPDKSHLLSLAEQFGIKHPGHILDEVISAIGSWKEYSKNAGVGKDSATLISKTLK